MTAKRVVVTGVTRGLGRALTAGFAAGGHTVVGCGRSKDRIAELRREFGPPHRFDEVDVSDDAAVAAWAEAILAEGGPPDLLINNAAVMNAAAPLWAIDAESFDRLIRINVCGVANVIRRVVPAMVARGEGVIVNLSSGWGRSTSPEVAPYCASKYAIEGLTKSLAQELPKGMSAVPLNPGVIDTDMVRGLWNEGASAYPKAEAWAKDAVPFLLALGASHNGKSLTVAGH